MPPDNQILTNPLLSPSPARTSTLQTFLQSFYATSDEPNAHEEYARDYFTSDATLIMGGKRALGFDEILAFRKSLWEKVSNRRHTAKKLFFGADDEVMLFGTVAYILKNGRQVELDWSARAEFVFDQSGQPKMRFYQVYLDTAAQIAAAQ